MSATLIDLIDHSNWVEADLTLGEAFRRFKEHSYAYMAILEEGRVLGLCSRLDLGMLLGSQYGFPLFAQKPLKDHLRPNPIQLSADSDIHEAFEMVFARNADTFHDDVLLLSPTGQFLGLIFTQTLVKLQNDLHQENIRLLKEQAEEINLKNQQIEADLRLSRELQQALLPESFPVFPPTADPASSAFRFHRIYRTAGIVGGDFFHVQAISDLCAGVFIADVMGHGVRAALVSAMLRALLEELEPQHNNPGELLTQLNRELVSILSRGHHQVVYATALYMIVNAATHTVCYATAGHPAPLHVRRQDNRVKILDHEAAGTLLGLFDNLVYGASEWTVNPGDSIILFTDGIFEVENMSKEEFGVTRMLETIGKNRHGSTAEVLDHLIRDALSYSANHQFTDDVCLLAVDFNT